MHSGLVVEEESMVNYSDWPIVCVLHPGETYTDTAGRQRNNCGKVVIDPIDICPMRKDITTFDVFLFVSIMDESS